MTTLRSYIANAVTAGAVALAAVTAGPGPAAAEDKDMLRALAGIAAIAVIAGALQNQGRAQQPVARAQPWVPVSPAPAAPRYAAPEPRWEDSRAWSEDRYQPVRGGPRLPSVCAVEVDGPRPATYYAESCLKREGAGYGLPQYCAQTIRSRDWQGRVYEGECLRDAGYRLGRW
jgi:hypothetical protein